PNCLPFGMRLCILRLHIHFVRRGGGRGGRASLRAAAHCLSVETIQTTVMKFGGTSVEDAAAFERVVALVRAAHDSRPAVVVSAMSRFTDALLAAFERAAGGEGATALALL